jgi:hypothetical protein
MAEIIKVLRGGTGLSLSEESHMWVRAAAKLGKPVAAAVS